MVPKVEIVQHVYDIVVALFVPFTQMVQNPHLDQRLVVESLLVPDDLDGDVSVGHVIERLDHLAETALSDHLQNFVAITNVVVQYLEKKFAIEFPLNPAIINIRIEFVKLDVYIQIINRPGEIEWNLIKYLDIWNKAAAPEIIGFAEIRATIGDLIKNRESVLSRKWIEFSVLSEKIRNKANAVSKLINCRVYYIRISILKLFMNMQPVVNNEQLIYFDIIQ